MCGRYSLTRIQELMNRYDAYAEKDLDINPNYNISPSFIMPVITKNSPKKIQPMKWGLIPSWAKDPRIGYKMINARAESIKEKPSFKNSFRNRRCLVPATGFYEWKKDGDTKTPYYFKAKDDSIFSFAGLYDIWIDAEGKEILSYTIITTEPNEIMRPIHNRMPVILKRKDEDKWLDISSSDLEIISMLKPTENEMLESYQVSANVNRPQNNSEELIKKINPAKLF
jgi:putative SOS response-associated peptidase YedK